VYFLPSTNTTTLLLLLLLLLGFCVPGQFWSSPPVGVALVFQSSIYINCWDWSNGFFLHSGVGFFGILYSFHTAKPTVNCLFCYLQYYWLGESYL